MKYMGMPMGMWALFAGSFQKQLTAVLGYDADAAKAITKKAKPKYKAIIADLPEFEKADRFKMNLANCAMIGAFILSMPEHPKVDRLTDGKPLPLAVGKRAQRLLHRVDFPLPFLPTILYGGGHGTRTKP